ncbi:DUF554 domain-containing protein [Diplocloster hominis]|uniref:DUF554 domain-containing protein n=1 Tax=Diplocloster hominis TaxID=3079010 RepID=UPI0031BB4C2E
MIGLGTLINTAAVLGGSALGMLFKNGLNDKIQDTMMKGSGVAIIFIGVTGTLQHMLVVTETGIETQGTMLLIFSLVLGSLLGQIINVEARMEQMGEKLKAAVHAKNDNHFVEGFVNTSLIICVGAMAIVGSLQDGLTGDYSMLAVKSVLDFVIVLVCASTYGIGVLFSAIPIFVYQGLITLLCSLFGVFVSDPLIANLSYIGSALIFCVGINVSFGKKFPVGNMLPALIIPVLYELLKMFHIFSL